MTSPIVVGSGPAGITAAHLLNLQGKPVRLVEAAAEPGGLWAGTETKGRYFERGMHNYVECGLKSIDDFYFGLPVQQHALEGKDRDRAGIFYNHMLQAYSPSVDLRETANGDQARDEIMKLLAGEAWEHGATALELAACKWGRTVADFVIAPILRKLYGTTSALHPRALDLTNLHRVILFGEKAMRELMASDWLRARLAWPDQDTLPAKYESGRRAFYPVEGMRALVNAALGRLQQRGVDVAIGVECPILPGPIYWAAGLPKLAKALGINFPQVTSRPLTVVNFTGTIKAHGLHYFHVYEPKLKTFRVTCYQNFSFFQQTTVELLDELEPGLAADQALAELMAMGFDISELGRVSAHTIPGALIVPNQVNDDMLEHFRRRVAELAPNVVLLGSQARNGLFFQPDVLRHVWNTINCYQQGG